MNTRLLLPCLIVLSLTGCALQGPLKEQAPWTPMGPEQWRVSTRDLTFTLRVDQSRNFIWRLENHARISARVQPQSLYLLRDDGERLTLWGGSQSEATPQMPLNLPPGGFVTLQYPIPYKNPLNPFPPEDRRLTLVMTVDWGIERVTYSFPFPKPEPADPDGEDP